LAINITDGKLFYKDNAAAVQVIGWKTVPATAGGTGQTSYAVGDLLYANTTTTLAKLADVATGNALISGGVGVAPSYGKIGLTTHVSGTLPTANGGTNLTSFTSGGVVYASSTSALTTGSVLSFDGTNLGIGTSSPANPLHIVSNTLSQLNVAASSGNTNAQINLEPTGTGIALIGPANNVAFAFRTNATERMRIDASGKLGLGMTPSGSYSFQIYGVGASAGSARIRLNNSSTGTADADGGGIAMEGVDLVIQNSENGVCKWEINGSERARIDSSGQLLIGVTSLPSAGSGGAGFRADSNGRRNLYLSTSSTSNNGLIYFSNPNGEVGSITVSGSATAYNTSSDYRLKNITGALTGYKERLMSLQPKQGTWKADGSEFRGFLAHEFAEPYSASVTGEKDAVDADNKPIMQAMQASSSEVMADLVALVKEQQAIIESLKARLDAANL